MQSPERILHPTTSEILQKHPWLTTQIVVDVSVLLPVVTYKPSEKRRTERRKRKNSQERRRQPFPSTEFKCRHNPTEKSTLGWASSDISESPKETHFREMKEHVHDTRSSPKIREKNIPFAIGIPEFRVLKSSMQGSQIHPVCGSLEHYRS